MIFNSKQLEELESAHEPSTLFESSIEDNANRDEQNETALAWRRTMIEEALDNVKRATARPVDPAIAYEYGSLLLDREASRFARVHRSVPGFLEFTYLTAGERQLGELDLDAYLKNSGAQKKVGELTLALGLPHSVVLAHLNRLNIQPVEGDVVFDSHGAAPATEGELLSELLQDAGWSGNEPARPRQSEAGHPSNSESKSNTSAPSAKPAKRAKKKMVQNNVAENDGLPSNQRRRTRAAQIANEPIPKKPVDPIDDPNTFIRQNFETLSNREIARLTGLSEHTIRRKLGEWKLRRLKGPEAPVKEKKTKSKKKK